MTTQETKSDGPAVLSSALLDAFDAFAQSLVAHPHRMTPEMWPKGWPFFEAGWSAAILAEREACARLCDEMSDWPFERHTSTTVDTHDYQIGIVRGLINATNAIRARSKT